MPDSQAAQAARNLCQQHPDMVAIAASELKDAIPVASEPVCKNTVWYVAGGQGVEQTPYFVQTNDIESQTRYASGVAAGLLMKDDETTKAGFITGPQASFTTDFAKGWEAGIKSQVPDAQVVSHLHRRLRRLGQGGRGLQRDEVAGHRHRLPVPRRRDVAVADAGQQGQHPGAHAGHRQLRVADPQFAISVIFSPGDYFAARAGAVQGRQAAVGTALTFHMGVDPVPTVKICKPTGDQAAVLDADDQGHRHRQDQHRRAHRARTTTAATSRVPDSVLMEPTSGAARRVGHQRPRPALEAARITKRFGAVVACDARRPGGASAARSTASSARTARARRTLMNMFLGLVPPDAGEILVDGQPVAHRATRSRPRRSGSPWCTSTSA